MKQILTNYLPERSVDMVFTLITANQVHLKIVKERVTRHGDYKRKPDGTHEITVNANLNKYRFLITLIHEIAHLVTFQKYGVKLKPHGKEWKFTFQRLMLPFIRPEIFPSTVLPLIANHFKNPKASSDTDARLSIALKQFDPPNDKTYIYELPIGSTFRIHNGRKFTKGKKRVKRYECIALENGNVYLFNPNAEVELLQN